MRMIDFEQIGKYKENNRIEAKRALGGLPRSIWETYSAFANTFGGIILLGVEEWSDKSFHTVDLPDPERLIKEFWEIVNDKEKVSDNILSKWDVAIHEIDGNRIISITVPRADRRKKPIYIGNNPYLGTYRRDGEGDYHCTEEEVRMLLRDREERTMDAKVLEHLDEEVFNYVAVHAYGSYLKEEEISLAPGEELEEGILCTIGAAKKDEDEKMHPTAAGLLMFGFEDEIVKEYPNFFLDYREIATDGEITERIVSNSGKWGGNLFEFYLRICGKIIRGLPQDIHKAVREAVANCMINGDYMGAGGLSIIKKKDEICITNPGSFRIDVQEAIDGGTSDPRNAVIAKIFNRIKVGTHTGKGVPDIYKVWQEKGFKPPQLKERLRPDRITLKLPLSVNDREEQEKHLPGMQKYREPIIDYVTSVVKIGLSEASFLLKLPAQESQRILESMVSEGILVRCPTEEEMQYQLKI